MYVYCLNGNELKIKNTRTEKKKTETIQILLYS